MKFSSPRSYPGKEEATTMAGPLRYRRGRLRPPHPARQIQCGESGRAVRVGPREAKIITGGVCHRDTGPNRAHRRRQVQSAPRGTAGIHDDRRACTRQGLDHPRVPPVAPVGMRADPRLPAKVERSPVTPFSTRSHAPPTAITSGTATTQRNTKPPHRFAPKAARTKSSAAPGLSSTCTACTYKPC